MPKISQVRILQKIILKVFFKGLPGPTMNTVNNRKICKLFNLYTVIFNIHVTVLSRKLLVTRLKERTGLITFFHKKVSGYH